MPRLNTFGEVAMGIGGMPASVNQQIIPDALGPHWINNDEVIIYEPSSNSVKAYNVRNGNRTQLDPSHPANDVRGGGHNWAAWSADPNIGLFSPIIQKPEAYLFTVGPDGAVAYKPVYQSEMRGATVRELSGFEWTLGQTDIIYELTLLGDQKAIWRNEFNNIKVTGLPQPIQIGNAWWPTAAEVDGRWYIAYYSDIAGLILHPFDSTHGWKLSPVNVDAFNNAIISAGDLIISAWSARAGELPEDLRERIINVLTEPAENLIPEVEVPVIGKPCWLVWYQFNQPPNPFPPGNAIIAIRYDITGSIKNRKGDYFAHGVDGQTVEEIEERVKDLPYPAVAYWDSRYWPRLPELRPQDWIAIQAYCKVDESPTEFENDLVRVINQLYPHYNQIALVCQCYTSNASLTKDLIGIVPVFGRLARDFEKVNMLLAFSYQGRATGYQDHPEVQPYWQELAQGITGEPNMPETEVPDESAVVEAINDQFPHLLQQNTRESCGKFTELVVCELHKKDSKWGHVKKSPGQNQYNGHAIDAIFYNIDTSEDVRDIIVSAGDGNPTTTSWGEESSSGQPWMEPINCEEPPEPPVTGSVLILDYDRVVRRSDPNGLLIRFDVQASHPVVEIEVGLEDDGEPAIPIMFRNEPRIDGRYCRALAFKPTVNGTWNLLVTAKDSEGNEYKSDGSHRVTVTF